MPVLPSKQQQYRAFQIALIGIVTSTVNMAAQNNVGYSISNEFRYGIGEQFEEDNNITKEYLENMFNSRIYLGDFRLGFRIQADRPREYGPDTLGLKEYYAEFVKDGLRARGGTFFNLVGNGLVFNSFESRPIGFDTQTEGVKLDYETSEFAAQAFGGSMAYPDILGTDRVEQYLIRGAAGEVRPIPEVKAGGSFVSATGVRTRSGFASEFDAYLREGYVEANYQGVTALFNYADKRSVLGEEIRNFTSSDGYGQGWYAKLGYTGELFGVITEFKDYRFDLVEPGERDVSTRSSRALPFQNPPTLIPEHDKALLARNPHAIDFNDELGFQVEALIYPTEDLTIDLTGSAGSRHIAWNPIRVTDENGETSTVYVMDGDYLSFPMIDDIRYSPFWEAFIHADYQVNEDVSLAIGGQRKYNVIYYDGDGDALPARIEEYRASTLVLESITSLSGRDNLHAILELQGVYDSKKVTAGNDSLNIAPYEGKFNNVLFTLEFTRSPKWSLNTRLEWTTTDKEQDGQRLWPVIGGTYRIGTTHTLGMQYGSERGGVVCTGGVCRFINPFTGFRLSLVSKL